jgi:two-component system, NtrC family, response regulator AtoC
VNTDITLRKTSDPSGPAGRQLHLLVMSADAFFSQPLPARGVVTVGRSSKCDVRVDDPLASRQHAQIQIETVDGGAPVVSISDAGSANGTRLRDTVLIPGEWAQVRPGETVTIGSTMVVVLEDRPPMGPRRLWSHDNFEDRLQEECERAVESGIPFALARLRFPGAAPWTAILPILVRDLPPPHVFAGYGPRDYEILLFESNPTEARRLIDRVLEVCRTAGIEGNAALAWYPRDGRSVDALVARANALVKLESGRASGEGGALELAGMDRVRGMAVRAASSGINVMILGETGVGKEVLARLIHQLSPRADKPFLALNCAGLSQTLIESELFGHERGAFTGAVGAKIGLLESANGGTVFLDEIGEMPLTMQAKLLRVIEAREVLPVGALRSRAINVRFVSATNRDLEAALVRGEFRSDLLFRLNVISLAVPPLRERVDEISALIDTFMAQMCRESGRASAPRVGDEAMSCLLGYSWPGNIRELKNVMERAFVLCDGPEIGTHHLPLEKMRRSADETTAVGVTSAPVLRIVGDLPPLDDPKKEAERQRMLDALAACNGNQTRAAELLGMPRRTFVYKLESYGIPRPQKGSARDKD